MAKYTIEFHDADGKVQDHYSLDLWLGNRSLTNRAAISIAQTFYAALAYKDQDSREALWISAGNDAEALLDKLLSSGVDWAKGVATMKYPMNGRTLTAVFTLNGELGSQLCPSENLYMTNAEKGFGIAFEAARRAIG